MTDRNVQYPNRYKMVPVEGTDNIVDLIPVPGDIENEGTFINKTTLLKDATAALYGFTAEQIPDVVPDDVLAMIKATLDNTETLVNSKAKIEIIEYTGTGTSGSGSPTTVNVPEWTKFVVISGVSTGHAAEGIGIFAKPKINATGYGPIGIGTGSTGTQYIYGYYAKWIDTTLSWYMQGSGGSSNAYDQLNYSGWSYIVYCVG